MKADEGEFLLPSNPVNLVNPVKKNPSFIPIQIALAIKTDFSIS
jgi:hypothetical protein